MTPLLTTITPYWDRPDAILRWKESILGATVPEVEHLLFCPNASLPVLDSFRGMDSIKTFALWDEPNRSIGHYHNLGAQYAHSEWIMKFDVDCIPNVQFFKALLPILKAAGPKEWFNCGMLNCTEQASRRMLSYDKLPLSVDTYITFLANRHLTASPHTPAATNFICRTKEYLELGGCDPRFMGWGWEDYQQIYMLERHRLGKSPFPDGVTRSTVTRQCREISRNKARELYNMDQHLCLLHHWHPMVGDKLATSDANIDVLFDYIQNHP